MSPNFKKKASRQDRRVAEKTGFRVRPNSGAVAGHKGDLGGPDIFLETKTRMDHKDHLGLQVDWLDKCRDQAFAMGKPIYLLVLSAGDEEDYVVLPMSLLRTEFPEVYLRLVHSEYYSGPDFIIETNGRYIKVPVDKLTTYLYRGRKLDVPVVTLVQPSNGVDVVIMYVEDFQDFYNQRAIPSSIDLPPESDPLAPGQIPPELSLYI